MQTVKKSGEILIIFLVVIVLLGFASQTRTGTGTISTQDSQERNVQASVVEEDKMATHVTRVTEAQASNTGDLEYKGIFPITVEGGGSVVNLDVKTADEKDLNDFIIQGKATFSESSKYIYVILYDSMGNPSGQRGIEIKSGEPFSIGVIRQDMKGDPKKIAFQLT